MSAKVSDGKSSEVLLTLEKRPLEFEPKKIQDGVAKLVLTLVQTITDVLERQAARRVESGTLTDSQIENLGLAFIQIRERMTEVADKFELKPEELGVMVADGQQNSHVTLVDIIDKLINQGTIIAGDVTLAVAGVDLATLRLMATLKTE